MLISADIVFPFWLAAAKHGRFETRGYSITASARMRAVATDGFVGPKNPIVANPIVAAAVREQPMAASKTSRQEP
jgi:hypothetical protein